MARKAEGAGGAKVDRVVFEGPFEIEVWFKTNEVFPTLNFVGSIYNDGRHLYDLSGASYQDTLDKAGLFIDGYKLGQVKK